METPHSKDHADKIVKRFTETAVSFGEVSAHTNEESLQHLIRAAQVSPEDTLLDVACGPGIVACAFAGHVKHVTGVDVTPAMIDQARARQKERGHTNMTWDSANLPPLPYADGSFSRVISRYAFHHFLEPEKVLQDMVRVCRPGGRVVVADVYSSEDPAKSMAYNHLEKLRDSSHTWIQPVTALSTMVQSAGLKDVKTTYYRIEVEMEEQLKASCTPPEEAESFRRLLAEDLGKDVMGTGAVRKGDQIHFYYPIVVLSGER